MVFEALGKVETGEMTEEELKMLENAACPGCGSCNGMFTANTMSSITETLGMSMPGCATALAVSALKRRIAKNSGERIDGFSHIRKAAGRKKPKLANFRLIQGGASSKIKIYTATLL